MHSRVPIKIRIHNTKNTSQHDTDRHSTTIEIANTTFDSAALYSSVTLHCDMHMRERNPHSSTDRVCVCVWNDDTEKKKSRKKGGKWTIWTVSSLALTAIKHDDFDVFDIRSLWLLSINIKRCAATHSQQSTTSSDGSRGVVAKLCERCLASHLRHRSSAILRRSTRSRACTTQPEMDKSGGAHEKALEREKQPKSIFIATNIFVVHVCFCDRVAADVSPLHCCCCRIET